MGLTAGVAGFLNRTLSHIVDDCEICLETGKDIRIFQVTGKCHVKWYFLVSR